MSLLFVLLCCVFYESLVEGQTVCEDVVFSGFSDCDYINGTLYVVETTHSSLDGLSVGLSFVGGSLLIESNDDLYSLSGLDSVSFVGGSLVLRDNLVMPRISDLNGLLEVGDSVTIEKNAELLNLDGLTKMSKVGGSVNIINNGRLSNIDGLVSLSIIHSDVNVIDNNELTSISGFMNLTLIQGHLTISNNSDLTTINGLERVATIGGDINIHSNTLLNELYAFEILNQSQSINITKNPWLTNIDGLSSITVVNGNLIISENDILVTLALALVHSINNDLILSSSLTTLSGLPSLSYVGGKLQISDNPFLSDFALSNLETVNFLQITSNPSLENINGLTKLQNANSLEITNNELLQSLGGFSQSFLSSFSGSLSITDNDNLENLDDLAGLLSLDQLFIERNGNLNNIDGLSSLTVIRGDLSISQNSLSDIESLNSLTAVSGNILIDLIPVCSAAIVEKFLNLGYNLNCIEVLRPPCLLDLCSDDDTINADNLTLQDSYIDVNLISATVETLNLQNFHLSIIDFLVVSSDITLRNGTLVIGGNLTISTTATTRLNPQNTVIQVRNCINFGGDLILETIPEENNSVFEYQCHSGQFNSISVEGCGEATDQVSYSGTHMLFSFDEDFCKTTSSSMIEIASLLLYIIAILTQL